MSRAGLHMAKSAYAAKRWDPDTANNRLSRREHSEWFNRYGYNLDPDERTPDFTHPASKPKTGSEHSLQTLPPEIREKIYEHLVDNVRVVGIYDRDGEGHGGFACIHPLAHIKSFRSEFLGTIEKRRLTKVTNYIVTVQDFDFTRVMEVVRQNEIFNTRLGNINVHVYLHISSTEIDNNKLLDWAGQNRFVHTTSNLCVRYAIGSMPAPNVRDKFMRHLSWLHRINNGGTFNEVRTIITAFREWWGDGDGIDDWSVEEVTDDDTYKPEEESSHAADDHMSDDNFEEGDDGDVVMHEGTAHSDDMESMQDLRDHDMLTEGRKSLASIMGVDPRISDPSKWEDPADEDADEAKQNRQRWRDLRKKANAINEFYGIDSPW